MQRHHVDASVYPGQQLFLSCIRQHATCRCVTVIHQDEIGRLCSVQKVPIPCLGDGDFGLLWQCCAQDLSNGLEVVMAAPEPEHNASGIGSRSLQSREQEDGKNSPLNRHAFTMPRMRE